MGVVLDRVLSGLTSGADLSEALVPDVDRTKSAWNCALSSLQGTA